MEPRPAPWWGKVGARVRRALQTSRRATTLTRTPVQVALALTLVQTLTRSSWDRTYTAHTSCRAMTFSCCSSCSSTRRRRVRIRRGRRRRGRARDRGGGG